MAFGIKIETTEFHNFLKVGNPIDLRVINGNSTSSVKIEMSDKQFEFFLEQVEEFLKTRTKKCQEGKGAVFCQTKTMDY